MKNQVKIAFLLLIFFTIILTCCKKDKKIETPTRISGTVVDITNDQPLPKATVNLIAQSNSCCFQDIDSIYSVTADEQGLFYFEYIPEEEFQRGYSFYLKAYFEHYSTYKANWVPIEIGKDNFEKNIAMTPPENRMFAKVDSADWEDCQPNPFGSPSLSAQYFVGYYFDIDGIEGCEATNSELYLKIYNLNDTGKYYLGGLSDNVGNFNGPKRDNGGSLLPHSTDYSYTGWVKISMFDKTSSKISGSFEFDAYNIDSNEVIKVTGGKFYNVKYYEN